MPEKDIFLSFIITTYKRNEWLGECLTSIIASIEYYQNAGGNKQLEIVICDDDPQQCEFPIDKWSVAFANMGVQFIYSINKVNLGDYFNRNEGIKKTSGKWIKFIDDDDLVYEWSVPFIVEKLLHSQQANTVIFYLRDNFRHLQFPVVLKNEEIFDFHYRQYGLFHCSLVSAVFLRADIIAKGGFKFKRFYGDFQIFHDMAANGCFFIYPIELGWYRMHPEQESNNNRKMVRIRFNYLIYSFNYFINSDITNESYLNVLLHDSFVYLKHAAKRRDQGLLKDGWKLRRFIKAYMQNEQAFKIANWQLFYDEQMSFQNNMSGVLTT